VRARPFYSLFHKACLRLAPRLPVADAAPIVRTSPYGAGIVRHGRESERGRKLAGPEPFPQGNQRPGSLGAVHWFKWVSGSAVLGSAVEPRVQQNRGAGLSASPRVRLSPRAQVRGGADATRGIWVTAL
jgi:hypothetical protein